MISFSTSTKGGGDNNIIARILERRLKMECQTEESENDEDDDRISDCTSVQVRLDMLIAQVRVVTKVSKMLN